MLHGLILLVLLKLSPSKLKMTIWFVPIVFQDNIALYLSLALFFIPSISVSFDRAIVYVNIPTKHLDTALSFFPKTSGSISANICDLIQYIKYQSETSLQSPQITAVWNQSAKPTDHSSLKPVCKAHRSIAGQSCTLGYLFSDNITKTCLYNFDPLKPHFYIVKLGFAGVRYFSYFCSKHRLWVLVRIASPMRF